MKTEEKKYILDLQQQDREIDLFQLKQNFEIHTKSNFSTIHTAGIFFAHFVTDLFLPLST